MAVEMHDHIHLDTDNPPADEYKVAHGTLDHTPNVPVELERALTGKLHVHRLVDGDGDPVQFQSDKLRMKLTYAEMVAVTGMAGKMVYYAFNYHDDDEESGALDVWPDSSYVVRSLLLVRQVTNLDPRAAYWYVTIELVDDDAVT